MKQITAIQKNSQPSVSKKGLEAVPDSPEFDRLAVHAHPGEVLRNSAGFGRKCDPKRRLRPYLAGDRRPEEYPAKYFGKGKNPLSVLLF